MSASRTHRPLAASLPRRLARQFRLPSAARFVIEALLLGSLFIACVWMSEGVVSPSVYGPMMAVTLAMLAAMTLSGVYRREIWQSLGALYLRSAYGFVLAGSTALVVLASIAPSLLNGKFAFLFLFLSFFALNTIRPLLSGGELRDGLGRRAT